MLRDGPTEKCLGRWKAGLVILRGWTVGNMYCLIGSMVRTGAVRVDMYCMASCNVRGRIGGVLLSPYIVMRLGAIVAKVSWTCCLEDSSVGTFAGSSVGFVEIRLTRCFAAGPVDCLEGRSFDALTDCAVDLAAAL